MNQFCGRCGSRLNADGLCPNCDPKPPKRHPWRIAGIVAVILALLLGGTWLLDYLGVIWLPEMYLLEDIQEGFHVVTDRLFGSEDEVSLEASDPDAPEERPEKQSGTTVPDEPDATGEAQASEAETTVPDETTAPETTVPETTLPPETTIPEETMPEPVLKPVPDPVKKASASSTMTGDVRSHDVRNLLDDDPETNWCEGADGYGIGEYLLFDFTDTYQLHSVKIRGGNRYNEQRFYNNARPCDVTLTFSDGSSESFTMEDGMESRTLVLSQPVMTSYVQITIDSVHEGYAHKGVDQDTVISDVSFETYELTCPENP